MSNANARLRIALFLLLPLLSSCTTPSRISPDLPTETSLNEGAGRGDLILLPIRFESHQVLFVLDTGAPFTLFDKSLETNLGRPLSSREIHSPYGTMSGRFFKAPKLYLGDTQLQIGDKIMTVDLSPLTDDLNRRTRSSRRVSGVLGMDCLRNYCIQLDFTARKMRFLDPRRLETDFGRAFPLTISSGGAFVRGNFLGAGGKSRIDTGCNFDGVLTPKLFRQWTNALSREERPQSHFPNSVFGENSYTNLLATGDGPNLIGLRFLARHLVTLNFPARTMFLKRTSIGPLVSEP